ncbi:ABC transporter substrate-binding protein [Georgenia sp. AZ-5]|uniref:ABC transporter substrate-binding protein n=1 Tax=Georgenia sp. AZ-5 TaxID=3367526 RepID=UPI0037547557
MKSRTLVAAVATGALLLTACQSGGADPEESSDTPGLQQGAKGDTLRLGIVQEPLSWDPAQAHVGHTLQPYQLAYDTLLLREPDGTLSPMLATTWEYTNEDNTVLSLELNTDVTFSDGEAFNAEAVKANIEHFKADNGRQASQAAAIESVTAVDEDTVEINLSRPDPALEYYLSQALGLMGSPAAIGTDEVDRVPVGTGPYEMVPDESVVGSQYVFTAKDGYWNEDLQDWNRIELRFLADVTARVNAIVSGEIDAVLLDGPTMEQAQGAGLERLDYTTDWMGVLLLDRAGQVNEALGDVRVRQAINYAFDREALLQELLQGNGEITSQVFGPETAGYDPELDTYYTYDPERAKALLAEAGYEDGLTIEMPVLTPGAETIMTFVQQQLADVGITVTLTSVPGADFQGELGQGKFAAAWFSLFQGPDWVAVSQMILPDVLYNPFDSSTPEVQGWIEAIRAGGDDGDAAAKGLNRFLVEEAWFAPWFRPSQIYFYNPDVVQPEPQVQMAVPSIYNYHPVG